MLKDVIAPPPDELTSEINDNSVAILLTYDTARVLLSGGAKARKQEHSPAVRTRGLKRSSGFRSTKLPEVRFSARLTEGSFEWKLARA